MKEHFIPVDVGILCTKIAEMFPEYSVYLGGGYLRDLEYGGTPKDIDLFFVPKEGMPHSSNFNRCYDLLGYPAYDYDSPTQDMRDRRVDRVLCYFTDKVSTQEINFIVYDSYMTLEEVALDFDMGINQIVYNPLTDVLYRSENYIKHHEQKVIQCLHTFSKERTWQRYQRMKAKFPTYSVIGEPELTFIEKLIYQTPAPTSRSRASA